MSVVEQSQPAKVEQSQPAKLVGAEVIGLDFGVQAACIRRWAGEGKIPAIRISNKVLRFDRVAVLKAVSARQA